MFADSGPRRDLSRLGARIEGESRADQEDQRDEREAQAPPEDRLSAVALAIRPATTALGGGWSAMDAEPVPERAASPPVDPLRSRGETTLVRAAQQGSHDALEELFRRHWRSAQRAAYLIVHDAAASEDIAQEAFLAAIRALDRFDRRRPFGPWLYRIAVNRAIDHARSRKLRGEVGGVADADGPAADDSGARISDELLAALAELAPEQRAVVVLRYLLGYTPGEIGEMLEMPRGTVNSRMRRALDRLRSSVEGGRP
jgi:RNA polymerase sigma-70 factor (ECF subfamily)